MRSSDINPNNIISQDGKNLENEALERLNTPKDFISGNDRKVSGDHPEVERTSLSSMSDSSTGVGNVTIGYESFLDISADKNDEGNVSVRIADERLRTWLGQKQGDHVITYELFLRFCARKINGKSLRDIPHILNAALSAIIPAMRNSSSYPGFPELLLSDRIKQGYKGLTEEEVDDLNTGRRYNQVKAIEQYVLSLAECYSKLPEVSRLKTDNKSNNEGVNTRAAIASLNAINEFLELNEDRDIDEQKKINFAKRCLAVNGDLVDGMRKLFNCDSINDVRRTFGLPVDVRINSDLFNNELAENFFASMHNISIDQNLIGRLIETYFDFPYKQYPLYGREGNLLTPSASKQAGLKTQKFENLITNASQCLAFTFGAFDKIQIQDGIAHSFLTEVIKNQRWKKTRNFDSAITDITSQFASFLEMEAYNLDRYYKLKQETKVQKYNSQEITQCR